MQPICADKDSRRHPFPAVQHFRLLPACQEDHSIQACPLLQADLGVLECLHLRPFLFLRGYQAFQPRRPVPSSQAWAPIAQRSFLADRDFLADPAYHWILRFRPTQAVRVFRSSQPYRRVLAFHQVHSSQPVLQALEHLLVQPDT